MRSALLAVALMVTACMPQVTKQGPPIGDGTRGGDRELPAGMRASAAQMSSKKVNGKEAPNTLVATDQSRCSVTEQKYRETAIGESAFCAWSKQ